LGSGFLRLAGPTGPLEAMPEWPGDGWVVVDGLSFRVPWSGSAKFFKGLVLLGVRWGLVAPSGSGFLSVRGSAGPLEALAKGPGGGWVVGDGLWSMACLCVFLGRDRQSFCEIPTISLIRENKVRAPLMGRLREHVVNALSCFLRLFPSRTTSTKAVSVSTQSL